MKMGMIKNSNKKWYPACTHTLGTYGGMNPYMVIAFKQCIIWGW